MTMQQFGESLDRGVIGQASWSENLFSGGLCQFVSECQGRRVALWAPSWRELYDLLPELFKKVRSGEEGL